MVTTGLTLAAAPVDRDMGSEMSHRLAADGNESRHHRTDMMDSASPGNLSAVMEFAATDRAAGVAPPSTPCVTWSMFRKSFQNLGDNEIAKVRRARLAGHSGDNHVEYRNHSSAERRRRRSTVSNRCWRRADLERSSDRPRPGAAAGGTVRLSLWRSRGSFVLNRWRNDSRDCCRRWDSFWTHHVAFR